MLVDHQISPTSVSLKWDLTPWVFHWWKSWFKLSRWEKKPLVTVNSTYCLVQNRILTYNIYNIYISYHTWYMIGIIHIIFNIYCNKYKHKLCTSWPMKSFYNSNSWVVISSAHTPSKKRCLFHCPLQKTWSGSPCVPETLYNHFFGGVTTGGYHLPFHHAFLVTPRF